MTTIVKLTNQRMVTALYACRANGSGPAMLFRSIDNATTWIQLPYPAASVAVGPMCWVTPDLGFAAIDDATNPGIYRTKDGGNTWTKVLAGAYNGIDMLDGALGYACGDGAVIMRTLDGGETWTNVGALGVGTANLNCIAAAYEAGYQRGGQAIINAVGELNAGYAAIVWGVRNAGGGETWTGIGSGGGAPTTRLECCDMWRGTPNATKYCLAGMYMPADGKNTIHSENTGINWTKQTTIPGSYATRECAVRSSLARLYCATDHRMQYSPDGGITYSEVGPTDWGPTSVAYLRGSPSSSAWFINGQGTVYQSTDTGTMWTLRGTVSGGIANYRLFAVSGFLTEGPALSLKVVS
jgi:photosystem II stability/assembly factor-like uncharacterized protein